MANYIEYIKVGSGESWPVRDKEAQDKLNDIVNLVYPVGSIYMSVSGAVSPDVLFGGTWERIQDRFLLAAGSAYEAGTTGGEATHILTDSEMPIHRHHGIQACDSETGLTVGQPFLGVSHDVALGFKANSATIHINNGSQSDDATEYKFITDAAGGDQPHNNMPPYLAVYMWRRIS